MIKNHDRPAKRVKFSPSDSKFIEPSAGGSKKFFKEVTLEFKNELIENINQATEILKHSNIDVGVMIVEIESKALAKSHRPINVFYDKTCPFIGDLGIDIETKIGKFLVRTTNNGLNTIKHKIQTSTAESFEKELSTIVNLKKYEPVLNEYQLSEEKELIIKLIDFKHEMYNEQKLKQYNLIVSQLGLFSREISMNSDIFYVRLPSKEKGSDFLQTLKDNCLLSSANSAKLINFQPLNLISNNFNIELPEADKNKDYPVVGVVDTSIKSDCPHIVTWYDGEVSIIIDEDKVYDHGTFVAGLISNSFYLNSYEKAFPKSQSKVFSVGVLSKDGAREHEIFDMLQRAQKKRPDIKVWNLSLGSQIPVSLSKISNFAVMLDNFQKENNCLCVIAAGNINQRIFHRKWPPQAHEPHFEQLINSPGDSVLGVTVSSVAQVDGIVKKFEPSIFSRSGPVANYVLKPDLSHFGGNHIENGPNLIPLGVTSLGMVPGSNCSFGQDCGTSFATPLVSTIAANLWKLLGEDTPRHTIKGLLAHSARLNQTISKKEKVFYGWGMPLDIEDFMFCNENEITIILDGEISSNTEIVGKLPFPIPNSLRTIDGKVKGEFFMTISYDPPLDSNRALEYCLVNVDTSLGEVTKNNSFQGKIPSEGTGYEQDLINGRYKWSPVKIYHKKFPEGVDVENWKLQVSMLTRQGFQPDESFVQPFSVILTIRALDPDAQIYNEMVTLMDQYNWEVQNANLSIAEKVLVK